jgi:uncharacterized protein involved in exopolysaccharide biosynthesis
MNQIHTLESQGRAQPDNGKEIDMIDLFLVLARHKKLILGATLCAAVLSTAVSFVLPVEYRAITKLLPPQQTQSSAAALLSQLGGAAGAAVAGSGGLKNPNDLYVGMLQSRTVADRMIDKFDLKKVYGTGASREKARRELEAHTSIVAGKEGLIVIEVEDENKQLVAPLANAYVSELFQLMKTLAVTDASQRRVFYERQLEATKDNLAKAEMALKSTMETRGVVSVDSESRAILGTMAFLKAQISAKEIQLSSMRSFVTNSNPEYLRAEAELNGLRSELGKLENGNGNELVRNKKPEGLENIKLLRDLKYQQMLYEVLAKQYEVARIDEAKDPSVIQVLDKAVEPEHRAKPRPRLIVLMSTIIATLLAIAYAFLVEAYRRSMQRPDSRARWIELRSLIGFGKSRKHANNV